MKIILIYFALGPDAMLPISLKCANTRRMRIPFVCPSRFFSTIFATHFLSILPQLYCTAAVRARGAPTTAAACTNQGAMREDATSHSSILRDTRALILNAHSWRAKTSLCEWLSLNGLPQQLLRQIACAFKMGCASEHCAKMVNLFVFCFCSLRRGI